MKRYIATGLDGAGRRRTDEVTAETAEEALALCAERGWRDYRLLSDDTFSALPTAARAAQDDGVSARDRYRLGLAGPLRARLLILRTVYVKTLPLVALGALLLAAQRVRGGPLGTIDVVGALMMLAPVIIVCMPARGPATYDRVLRSAVAADWQTVEQLLPALRKAMQPMGEEAAVMETELWRAKVLAATGRRAEAMEVAEGIRKLPSVSAALADRRIAEVYAAAQDYRGARDLFERSAASAPEDAAAWLALAEVLAVRLEEPQRAREALDRASSIPLAEITEKMVLYIEGAIALCEDRWDDARDCLQLVLADLRRIANPLARAIEYQGLAMLAIAEAHLGEHDSARVHFRRAEPFLRRHGDQDMLDRSERALGVATGL
ncbi:MAG: tetratricopeptide repeat protein [Phycisphaerales bacterium JB039]